MDNQPDFERDTIEGYLLINVYKIREGRGRHKYEGEWKDGDIEFMYQVQRCCAAMAHAIDGYMDYSKYEGDVFDYDHIDDDLPGSLAATVFQGILDGWSPNSAALFARAWVRNHFPGCGKDG